EMTHRFQRSSQSKSPVNNSLIQAICSVRLSSKTTHRFERSVQCESPVKRLTDSSDPFS
ncbi:hypothetical protein M9458_041356, partial [Cirrhinus mrigala]